MGPYEVASFAISKDDAKSHNYGGATVYYPRARGQTFGVVAMMPGFLAFQAVYESLVKKIASHRFIVACEKDTIAPNKSHSDPFYASLPATLPRAEIEVRGASHLCATFLASQAQLNTMNKATVAWLKRFLDEDMRYDAMVKGGIDEGEFTRFIVQGF